MNEQTLKRIIDNQTKIYLNNIARELEESHDKWFDSFGFPIFGVTSKDYHEQVYFESYLESYTRKMINSILRDMADEECILDLEWPEFNFNGEYNGYTNKEYEETFGFEFIDRQFETGYRYTYFYADQLVPLLEREKIKSICIILWEDEETFGNGIYEDNRVNVVRVYDFLKEFFGFNDSTTSILYDLLVSSIKDAVNQANSMISLVTLPGFTRSFMHRFRYQLVNDLESDILNLHFFGVKNKDYKYIENNSKVLIDDYHLAEMFVKNNQTNVFFGNSRYAKSFITSEYLYRYFERNPMFDYTSIVSGYIKAIELLLDAICVSYRNGKHIFIKMSKFTLGEYIHFIKNNPDIFKDKYHNDGYIVTDCLNSYLVKCRNRLFHKDYFDNWDRVKTIRSNTLFLIVVLLEMIDDQIRDKDARFLGIIDDGYDRLFSVLDKQSGMRYSFQLDGKEYSEIKKKPRSQGLFYDQNGLIENPIVFEMFENDAFYEIVINPQNYPKTIWAIGNDGNRKQVVY